ncbi:MAG: hypothetical protein LBE70_02175 [Nitrososphaerota archaeon]|jgi:hypothetical protein|nr:hypothetical protein [Nitrososphaerota archaeon]
MSVHELLVTYTPYKQISIFEKTFFDAPEDLARFITLMASGRAPGLYWANGIVFIYVPLSASVTNIAKELIENGKQYWLFVGYTLMPTCTKIIETKEKLIVPVIDVSSNEILNQVTKWLKQQK